MGRALLVLNGPVDRDKAIAWIKKAPTGTRVTFQASKRSLDQNSKIWACITDVSNQVEWHGMRLSTTDWKLIFMQALNSEMRIVPAIDGKGFVNLGTSSSKLSKHEASMLIELILCFGANHDVKFAIDGKKHEPHSPDDAPEARRSSPSPSGCQGDSDTKRRG